ncbi:HNH endonuclease [Staphylococcus aureus]|uniref:HNH endonuclease n=1 Tax=Staphylococcus aureus TaxID=1280 RepID=UPI000DFD2903|nr:HNH endonuclease signature motif containing protein [Staphylococcus aureus]SUK02787.1 HNH endonuclease family protein [Staphylococcus aureus]SUK10041.1 HNH endonuclease family protein [Staphylococcus aureus]
MKIYDTKDKRNKFYHSTSWNRLRMKAYLRDNRECQHCKREDKVVKGQNVHHIKPIDQRPDLALDINNLITLCIDCHNKVHGRVYGGTRKQWNDEQW